MTLIMSLLIVVIGLLLFAVILASNVEPYCKKHKKPMKKHGFYDLYRCDDCWEEESEKIMREEYGD